MEFQGYLNVYAGIYPLGPLGVWDMFKTVKKSLDNRITFSVVLIIVLMMTAVSFFVYRFTFNKVSKQLTETTLLQTQAISLEVEDLFENANIVADQLSFHKEIRTYLYEVKTRSAIKSHPLYKDVREAIAEIKSDSTYYSTIWIANDSADFYFDDIGNLSDETYDAKKRPWYNVAISSHGVSFTKPYMEWSTKETVLSAIKALRDAGEVYGFVAVDVTLESIPELFATHHLNYNEEYFLISEDGQYVYHPDEASIMTTSILDEEDTLFPYKKYIYQGQKIFKEIVIDNKEMFLLSYPVELADWYVVTLIPKDVLFQQIQQLFSVLFLMMLITLAVTSIVIRTVVKSEIRPFEVLSDFGQAIANGALDKNIPEEYIHRDDDMGKLSKAFQQITDTFRNENAYLEERIKEKNEALERQYEYILETEKVASLGSLVAGVAHEINTPLGNSVTSLSYLSRINANTKQQLLDSQLSAEELVKFMEEIDKSVVLVEGNLNRAVDLVENFKKIAVHQEGEVPETVQLDKLINMVVTSMKGEIKKGAHHVLCNCPENLEIKSYPGALIQVFTNLLSNSLIHGFKDKREGRVDIEVFEKDDRVNILYKDNGCGMTKASIKRIYEPFYTTTRQEGSIGLGMAIVFNLVNQKLDGTINVTSSENRGVTIMIHLPR